MESDLIFVPYENANYMNKFHRTFLIALSLFYLSACGQTNDSKKQQTKDINIPNESPTIETFSDFPPEIIGCSCYYSNDSTEFKNGEYIYMDDFSQISFLKINGVLTRFTQTELKVNEASTIAKAKSDQFELTIEIKDGPQSGYETSIKTGTIKLIDQKGHTVTKKFYGECGC